MAEKEHQSPEETTPIGIHDLYNSSPSKIQPWMQVTGAILPKAKECDGTYDPALNTTHGVEEGSFLIMENAPRGLKPKIDS